MLLYTIYSEGLANKAKLNALLREKEDGKHGLRHDRASQPAVHAGDEKSERKADRDPLADDSERPSDLTTGSDAARTPEPAEQAESLASLSDRSEMFASAREYPTSVLLKSNASPRTPLATPRRLASQAETKASDSQSLLQSGELPARAAPSDGKRGDRKSHSRRGPVHEKDAEEKDAEMKLTESSFSPSLGPNTASPDVSPVPSPPASQSLQTTPPPDSPTPSMSGSDLDEEQELDTTSIFARASQASHASQFFAAPSELPPPPPDLAPQPAARNASIASIDSLEATPPSKPPAKERPKPGRASVATHKHFLSLKLLVVQGTVCLHEEYPVATSAASPGSGAAAQAPASPQTVQPPGLTLPPQTFYVEIREVNMFQVVEVEGKPVTYIKLKAGDVTLREYKTLAHDDRALLTTPSIPVLFKMADNVRSFFFVMLTCESCWQEEKIVVKATERGNQQSYNMAEAYHNPVLIGNFVIKTQTVQPLVVPGLPSLPPIMARDTMAVLNLRCVPHSHATAYSLNSQRLDAAVHGRIRVDLQADELLYHCCTSSSASIASCACRIWTWAAAFTISCPRAIWIAAVTTATACEGPDQAVPARVRLRRGLQPAADSLTRSADVRQHPNDHYRQACKSRLVCSELIVRRTRRSWSSAWSCAMVLCTWLTSRSRLTLHRATQVHHVTAHFTPSPFSYGSDRTWRALPAPTARRLFVYSS